MIAACDNCGCALHECECAPPEREDPPDPYAFIDEATTPWVDGSGLTPGPLPRRE